MVELGGNIKLEGFEDTEKGSLVIVKKIVGNYVKDIQEKQKFKSLEINLKNKTKLDAKLELEGKTIEANVENKNIFFGLNELLKELSGKL